jgi:hypothetical protein
MSTEQITRAQKKLDETTEVLRELVGELTDIIADQDATLASLRAGILTLAQPVASNADLIARADRWLAEPTDYGAEQNYGAGQLIKDLRNALDGRHLPVPPLAWTVRRSLFGA